MQNDGNIRAVVAKFFRVPESEITESFLFPPERMQGSVARSTLHAALKRMAGVDLPSAFTANSYGELTRPAEKPVAAPPADAGRSKSPELSPAQAVGDAATPVVENPAGGVGASLPEQATSNRLSGELRRSLRRGRVPLDFEVGTDIESSANLSWTGDPWTDPFYQENFTPGEIAHCLRRPNPRLSFCGLWTAKEAVIKCLGDGNRPDPRQIEISHDENGKPYPRFADQAAMGGARGSEFRLSISHAGELATAVCARIATEPGSASGTIANNEGEPAGGPASDPVPTPVPPVGQEMKEAEGLGVETVAWAGLALSAMTLLLLLMHYARR